MSFVGSLEKLLHAYEHEADLSAFGRHAARFDIMRCLTNFLRLDAAEDENPGLRSHPVKSPVFITGLPRSATTFFHTLLSQDENNAVPRCWQLLHPYPPRHPALSFLRKIQVELHLRLFRCLAPGLSSLHPISAGAPQECTDITGQVFQSLRFETTHHMPSYQSWLESHGHLAAFHFHRRFLRHLGAQLPGRHWILKSPDHVFTLDAIHAVYPDAKIVFLHRDPLSVVASCSRLTELLRRPFARRVDRTEIGRHVSNRLVEGTDRMVRAASQPNSILHLNYRDVVSAPMDAVKELYHHCGRTLDAKAEQAMWASLVRAKGRPPRKYSLAEFGLDPEDLAERFAPYTQTFAVDQEWLRTVRHRH
jgi:hypothetical protein